MFFAVRRSRKVDNATKAREAFSSQGGSGGGGAAKLLGGAGTFLTLTRSVMTGVVGFVTIVFLTFFMILEGPGGIERGLQLMPASSRPPSPRFWRT